MPTPNLSDEELDALFRRATEAYPEEDGTAAWQGMERPLDELARHHGAYRQVLRWFAAEIATVAVLLLLWFTYAPALLVSAPSAAAPQPAGAATSGSGLLSALPQTYKPRSTNAGRLPASDAAAPKASAPATVLHAVATEATARSSRPQRPDRRPHVRLAWLPSPPKRHLPSASRPESGFVGVIAASDKKTVVPGDILVAVAKPGNEQSKATTAEKPATTAAASAPAGQLAPALTVINPATQPTEQPATQLSSIGAGTSNAGTLPAATLADSSAHLKTTPPLLTLSDSAGLPAPVAPESATTAPADSSKLRQKQRPTYRFGVLLQYAPEVSTVRFSPVTKTGSNVGGQLEYFFTERLSLNVGVLRAMKRYEARGSDYHARPAYLPYNVEIDEVYAACRMVDIPLNVRYALRVQPKYRLFASAGLSSLLMRDEQYEYYYDYYNRPVQREWRVQKGSNHWLSVVNLSVGYERQVAARWGLRAEPFVKIPLGGVGAGQVRLSSAGIFFGAQYRLLKPAPH
ncbi:PorT family protein [Hymenobacter sp. J193]|uniref:PorT family protein n=1 Tax=Hymenobacter sp. J193 TaxID=2898429 RepID=UPI0021514118|nr:PorT family protein [Hymenobacter sp. J193]MCR5888720.1 PorT family protein [Hymenobacter sp. J193]